MDLAVVMTELANRLSTLDGVDKAYAYPPDDSPANIVAWVQWPEAIQYDHTMRRGQDRATVVVRIVVPRSSGDSVAWARLAAFADGSGNSSVKAVLEAGTYSEIGQLRVTGAVFDYGLLAGVPAIAADFNIDVTGAGE